MQSRHHRGGLVGPVLLIGLGLLLLAQNLGLVGGDIWLNLLRMWPVILVAAGIDLLIPRRSALGTFVSLVLVVAVFVGGFWLSGARFDSARPGDTVSVSVPLGDATQAKVTFSPPVAALDLRALTTKGALLDGTVPKAGYGRVDATSSMSGTTAIVDVTASGTFIMPAIGPRDETWRFGLSTAVPIELRIASGMGVVQADLTGVQVDALEVEIGLGRSVITLPAGGDFRGHVSGAIGETVVIIPEGAAVHITMTTGLGGVETPDGSRPFDLGDNEYTSPGFGAAQDRIELEIEQAIGMIVVREG